MAASGGGAVLMDSSPLAYQRESPVALLPGLQAMGEGGTGGLWGGSSVLWGCSDTYATMLGGSSEMLQSDEGHKGVAI